jgi:hypothetical protein
VTKRAFILGVLGAALLCGVTFYNDMVIRGSLLVGSYLPSSVFGGLILVVLLLNPVLARVRRGFALTGAELGVITAMVLFACAIPGRGLMHHFTTFLMLPHHRVRTNPAWQGDPVRVAESSVADWPRLVAALRAGAGEPDGTPLRRVWDALSEADRSRLVAVPPGEPPALDLRERILAALNARLGDPDMAESALHSRLTLPDELRRALPDTMAHATDVETLARVNRKIFDACLPGAIVPRQPTIIEHAPPVLLADPGSDTTRALDGFVNGLGTGDAWISPAAVPWHAWTRTMRFWVPLLLVTAALVIGLALVLHRQWADHEKLPYPIVEFAHALLPTEDGRQSPILRERLFWLGAAPVFLLYMNNYAATWWPQALIRIPTEFDFWPLLDLVPVMKRSGVHLYCLFKPSIYFSVVGITYFLASDAAFSLGIAPYVYGLVMGIAAGYGVTVGGAFLRPSIGAFNYAGGYCAMFLVLLYTGRQYYLSVLRRAVGLASADAVEPAAVWGGRVSLGAAASLVGLLAVAGLAVPLGILYVAGTVVIYVVASRLVAEVGVFKLQPFFFPCVLVWGWLGVKAIGPDQLLIMSMVTSVILIYPREAIMPFVVCGLRLAERVRARTGTAAWAGYGAFAVGLAVAIPVTLYIQYQYGAIRAGDGWASGSVPSLAFDASCAVRTQLAAQGSLDASLHASALQRLAAIRPLTPCIVGFGITFGLTWLFTILRHRFAWWPFHPVMFLVLASWQSTYIAFSLLLGWGIKAAVTKYGGAMTYQRLRPVMIGLIAGELLAGVMPVIVGTVYYLVTGTPPPEFGFR